MTTSGKTYTLAQGDGLIPHILNYLFAQIQNESETTIQMQYLQLYNEQLLDLLDTNLNNKKQIDIKQDTISSDVTRIYTTNTRTITVTNYKEAMNVFINGNQNRKIAATELNHASSRSHCILSILLKRSQNGIVTRSRLNIADLSGSERLSKSKVTNQQFKEMVNINQGLLCLGNVIRKLSSQEYRQGKQTYINYRDSKLTYLLSDSLGGTSQCVFIACVSPSEYNYNETVQTIMYAARAKNIVNHVYREVERAQDSALDKSVLLEVEKLNMQLQQQKLIINQLTEQLQKNGIQPDIQTQSDLQNLYQENMNIYDIPFKQVNNPEINSQVRYIAESEEQQNNIIFTTQMCRQLYLQLVTLISSRIDQQKINLDKIIQNQQIQDEITQLPWDIQTQINLLSFLYCLYQQMQSQESRKQIQTIYTPKQNELDDLIDDINFYNQCRQNRIQEINYIKFDQLLPDDLESMIQMQQNNQLLKQRLQEIQLSQEDNVIILDGIEESLDGAQFDSDQIQLDQYNFDDYYQGNNKELSSNQSTTNTSQLNERLEELQQQLQYRNNNGVIDVDEYSADNYGGNKTQSQPLKKRKVVKKNKNNKQINSL